MSKILILTPRFPYPVIGGDRLRIHYLCRELAKEHRLTLLSLCATHEEMTAPFDASVFAEVHRVYLAPWQSMLHAALAVPTRTPLQIAYFRSKKFARKVDELCPKHDLALAHLIRTGQYLMGRRELPRVLEMTDAISMNYSRLRTLPGRGIAGRVMCFEARRLKNFELAILEDFDMTTIVSAVDRDFLTSDTHRRIVVVPNGVDLDRLPPVGSTQSKVVVFIGNLVSVQNQDACWFFIAEVMPLLMKSLPAMRFRIVGRSPANVLARFNAHQGVDALGEVQSIGDAARGAVCGVCPVRAGAGVQNKVLEYLALGLPAVTTPVGLEGLPAIAGRDLLVAEDAPAMARMVLKLHDNPELRSRLSASGLRLVRDRMSWSENLKPLCEGVDSLLSTSVSQAYRQRPEAQAALTSLRPAVLNPTNVHLSGNSL